MIEKEQAAQFGKQSYETQSIDPCHCAKDLKEAKAIQDCQKQYPTLNLQEFCKLGILVAKEKDLCAKKE